MPAEHQLEHIRINAFAESTPYGSPPRGMGERTLVRERQSHGERIRQELIAAFEGGQRYGESLHIEQAPGVYLEVHSAEGEPLPALTWKTAGIRLGAVRVDEEHAQQIGAIYVPYAAQAFLLRRVEEYLTENTDGRRPRPKHQDKIEPIEAIRVGRLESLWTDVRALEQDVGRRFWWECWCWADKADGFSTTAVALNLRAAQSALRFPEITVVPVYANRNEMARLIASTDAVEELRYASDTPTFFTRTVRLTQHPWVDDLSSRVTPPGGNSPIVCILDSGVARAHPLLQSVVAHADCHSVNADWGVDDHSEHGHGTNMAGMALYGDLLGPLSSTRRIELSHGLESVKLLPPPSFQPNDPMSYGAITQSAIAIPEAVRPDRARVYCMAVTNKDVSGERPSSWSAALDQACAGVMPGEEIEAESALARRLFIVSAGNVPDVGDPDLVSDIDEFPIEDPAQSWNAIAVGGFTDKVTIAPEDGLSGWKGWAEVGSRSPYSRVSTDWNHSRTPIKPEVVFEAGNVAINDCGTEIVSGVDSLSLLTTAKDFVVHPITHFWATSAATAQAARFCAQILAERPGLWPETVRALMVHSADWTPAMRAQLADCRNKRACRDLVRQFGYGVPDVRRAIASAQNDLALIAEARIQPFKREHVERRGRLHLNAPTFNEAHFYQLPWPRSTLEALDMDVRLKVTLSYFVEPSPSAQAPLTPAHYRSFGLRFAMKKPGESASAFRRRVNRFAEVDGDEPVAAPDDRWLLGPRAFSAGSLHCDVWEGPAAELAAKGLVAVYPVGGWWKTRFGLDRHSSVARYALVVSITAPDIGVDLYTDVANQINVGVQTPV